MVRLPVVSSNIASVGYDKDTEELEIEFKDSTIYLFSGVSFGEYVALLAAPSAGKYFIRNIKGRYETRRLQ